MARKKGIKYPSDFKSTVERKNASWKYFISQKLSLKKTLGKYEVTISSQELYNLFEEQKGLCAISNVPMTWIAGKGRQSSNISLDRKDNDKGYIPGNVQLVCVAVNLMKAEMDIEELKFWCERILENGKST